MKTCVLAASLLALLLASVSSHNCSPMVKYDLFAGGKGVIPADCTELDLSSQSKRAKKLDDTHATRIAESLKEHKSLTWLSLSGNAISQVGADALSAALESNKALTTFKLWDNKPPKGKDEISEETLDKLKEICEKNKDAASRDPRMGGAKKVEVIPDQPGAVTKHIFQEGTGEYPGNGAKVKAHYTGTLLNGEKFDSSRDRGDPFDFTLGQGQVIQCWDKGFATMRKGEKALLTCKSDFAYGDQGSPPKIPGGATLKFDVELISFEGPSKKEL